MRGRGRAAALLLCGAWLVLLAGCQSLDCGQGTHQEGDQCVPNLAVSCDGDLVEFRDGRCVPRAGVCGAGTTWDAASSRCVASGDAGYPEDMGAGDAVDLDWGDLGQGDVGAGPACEQPAQGALCVSGQVLDWSTGAPPQTEEALGLLIDDLFLRSAQPAKAPFAAALVDADGGFVLGDVPLQDDLGPLQQMILVAGAADPEAPSAWQRSLTGVLEPPAEGARLEQTPAYVVPSALVQGWGELLGDQIEGALGQEAGLLLLRVLDVGQGTPVAGASVRFTQEDLNARYQVFYLSDDLRSFLGGEATGGSGAVLVVGPAGQGSLTAQAPGLAFSPVPVGVNPGLAVVSVLLGVAP